MLTATLVLSLSALLRHCSSTVVLINPSDNLQGKVKMSNLSDNLQGKVKMSNLPDNLQGKVKMSNLPDLLFYFKFLKIISGSIWGYLDFLGLD